MIQFFTSLNIGKKVTLFTFSLVALVMVALVVFVSQSTARIVEHNASEAIAHETTAVRNMIELFDRATLASAEKFYKVFASDFPAAFALDTTREVDAGGTLTPVLKNGDVDLNLNFPMVDGFSDKTGVTATIFVKKGADFVRIATSVKKENGQRAVGTMLDRKHPAYPLLMSGQTYRGVATLFGKQFATEYQPVKDASQQIVGVLYVGVNISPEVEMLKERIKALKIGETGFFYVLNGKEGSDYGTMLVHPSMQGKNVLTTKDDFDQEYIKTMLETKDGQLRYTRMDSDLGEKESHERMAVYSTYSAWNWTIVGVIITTELTEQISTLRNMSFLFGAVALLLFAGALYVLINRLVTRPLDEAKSAAMRVAEGDLTARVAIRSQDEIGDMAKAINSISEGLAKVVGSIREGTDQVSTASLEIASGNQDLSSRTEQQASSLEETASSMEELTSTVKQNADNARQANQLAVTASGVAVKGGDVVSQVVTTMESINESARKIADIIGVIDGIAFQTNILALNAAVEAARAGEQGRGFAVVASEVRNLAQRSAAAAKEIKDLIGDSVGKVEAGSKLVNEAGSTMQEVVSSVRRVTDVMAEIMAASQEQSAGIEQVNQAIGQMDQVTQQNAALVEEAAAAAESLQDQSAKLAQVVSVFKLDGMQGQSAAEKPARKIAAVAIAPKARGVAHTRAPVVAKAASPRRPALIDHTDKDWEEF